MFSTWKLTIIGYIVEVGEIKPDPEHLRPLLQFPALKDAKNVCRVLGFFSHNSQWIHCYSEKMQLLITACIWSPERDIERSVVNVVKEEVSFEVETDACDLSITATVIQNGRPVEFFSRAVQGPEISHV